MLQMSSCLSLACVHLQDVQEALIFENPHTEYTMEVSTAKSCQVIRVHQTRVIG